MPYKVRTLLVVVTLLLAGCSGVGSRGRDGTAQPGHSDETRRLSAALSALPLHFVENRGQADPAVAYYLAGRDTTAYFGSGGLTLALVDNRGTRTRWVLKLDLLGADPMTTLEGRVKTSAVTSYFRGDMKEWKAGVPTYSEVAYEQPWPGIDLVYSGTQSRLKYEFRLSPGADPTAIRLSYRGITGLRIDERGRLLVSTPVRTIVDEAPLAYQEIAGRRVEVASAFTVQGNSYGFRLGNYDRTRPLVIDPAVLVYAGFIGGMGNELGNGIAVDGAGNAYVAGETASAEATFPEAAGPDLSYNGGAMDAFVAKVNPQGSALTYAGYIGGTGDDIGIGVAVDSGGNAYVTGSTTSATGFPTTPGAFDGALGGPIDAFVAKVNPGGTALTYATYLGGDHEESGDGIAVDSSGNAYVTGATNSVTFPTTAGAFDTALDGPADGPADAFVAKMNPAGAALMYSTYLGGSGDESGEGSGISVDSAGSAYVTGDTTSSNFPVTAGAVDTTIGGFRDGFLAKVNPTGTGLTYALFLGGSAVDFTSGVAVDPAGNAFVVGETSSSDFPVVLGPDLSFNGDADAFVGKVNAAGTALIYAGYLGGDGEDIGNGIAIDAAGNAYITGQTDSPQASFPETVGPFLTFSGGLSDAFVAGVNPQGTGLDYAGYIGGAGEDLGNGIAVDAAGNAYVTGETTSSAATFPERIGPALALGGGHDAFVARIVADICGAAATIQGTSAGETLVGTPGDDVIVGLGGNDTIDGMGGADTICGGDGNDTLVGGEGDDSLDGGAGNDTLLGRTGNDLLNGGAGKDTASFRGAPRVTADLVAKTATGEGSDTLAGIENLRGSSGKDVLRGDALTNRLEGLGGADRLVGRGRNDILIGARGRDRLSGGDGRDRLSGGRGPDRLAGGKGRDRLDGGRGLDVCDGGSGLDSARNCEVQLRLP
jgi:Ca2+-binding RTX toxin-like protein